MNKNIADYLASPEEVMILRNGEGNNENYGKPWTDEERDRLDEAYHSGVGITKLALEFGRSESAIIQQLKLMGAFKKQLMPRNRYDDQCRCRVCRQQRDCKYNPQNCEKERDPNA